MTLPTWPPRDWRALIALLGSIGGAFALTGVAGALIAILAWGDWRDSTQVLRIEFLGKSLLLALGGSLVVLISLGLAINKRSVRVSKEGFDMTGGDDSAPVPPIVTTTTTTAVSPAAGEPA